MFFIIKKSFITFLSLFLLFILSGCTLFEFELNGKLITKESKDLSNFEKVNLELIGTGIGLDMMNEYLDSYKLILNNDETLYIQLFISLAEDFNNANEINDVYYDKNNNRIYTDNFTSYKIVNPDSITNKKFRDKYSYVDFSESNVSLKSATDKELIYLGVDTSSVVYSTAKDDRYFRNKSVAELEITGTYAYFYDVKNKEFYSSYIGEGDYISKLATIYGSSLDSRTPINIKTDNSDNLYVDLNGYGVIIESIKKSEVSEYLISILNNLSL